MSPRKRGALSCAPIQLTERDLGLLETLTHRVKLLPVAEVRRLWWPGSTSTRELMRRVVLLERAGWLKRRTVVGRRVDGAPSMLASWNPGELLPDFADVVWRSRRRARSPVRAVQTVIATEGAANLTGGRVRAVRASEVSHDLLVTSVFAETALTQPAWARVWRGELVLGAEWLSGGCVPDAMLALPGRSVVVEVVGSSYSTTRMREMHSWCSEKKLGYQLW